MLLEGIGGLFTFQTFDDSPAKRRELVRVIHGSFSDNLPKLTELNKAGAGIFFCVNETDLKGRSSSNVTRVRALFADFDDYDPLREFDYELKPSFVVESSPGKYHCYWLLDDELPLEQFKPLQKLLASKLGSDPSINNLDRVLRVPGFTHQKGDPFTVQIIEQSGMSYLADDLREWLNYDATLIKTVSETTSTQKPVAVVYEHDDPDAMAQFSDLINQLESAGEGERNNTLNRVAFVAFGLVRAGRLYKGFVKERLYTSALSIGLADSEITATINSAIRKSKPVYNPVDLLPVLKPLPTGLVERNPVNEPVSDIVWMTDIKPENPEWLWEGWLCKKAFELLAGAPSAGKTNIALDFAAILSTGGQWPDGTRAERQKSLIFTNEDDHSMTILPRLMKRGADLSMIGVINKITLADGSQEYFNPGKHMLIVAEQIKRAGNVGLVIIDPIGWAVTGDHNKNEDVRRGLEPVLRMIEHTGCSVLGITHFGKNKQGVNPNERILGSTAFTAVSRIVLTAVTETDEHGSTVRTLAKSKANITSDEGGYRYSLHVGPVAGIKSTVSVEWGEFVSGKASDIINDAEQSIEERSQGSEAREFLLSLLEDGARDSKSVMSEARKQGISRRSLDSAKRALKVIIKKHGFRGGWEWQLPDCNL